MTNCCPHSEVALYVPWDPLKNWSAAEVNEIKRHSFVSYTMILHTHTHTCTHTCARTHIHTRNLNKWSSWNCKIYFLITIIKNRWIRSIWTLLSEMPAWVFWHDCCDHVLQPVIYSWEVRMQSSCIQRVLGKDSTHSAVRENRWVSHPFWAYFEVNSWYNKRVLYNSNSCSFKLLLIILVESYGCGKGETYCDCKPVMNSNLKRWIMF